MYRNSNSVIRINIIAADQFGVKVGVHQGSVLFITVLEAILRECRSSLSWEMLYADDLVIIAESLEEWGNGLVG